MKSACSWCTAIIVLSIGVALTAQESVKNDEKDKTAAGDKDNQREQKSDDQIDESQPKTEVDEILAGHSYHGDAFNEGPRQKAYLMGGTGNVHFPVTTKSKTAQAFINQGVGQLHGFWDLEAERSFRQAAALDPDCAMAYWGAALATLRNRKRARGFSEKARKLVDKVSKREQMYIKGLDAYLEESPEEKEGKKEDTDTKKFRARNYLKSLESISLEFPDDLEAKAFIALRIWQNSREGIPISSYMAADSLIREIYEKEPLHPAHHFTIHLWDYRKPEKALQSAARCGPAAPSIAHMWHMPGHIYSRLKRYEDAVYQQEASARVDHAHMMRDRVMPDEIHNYAHNNEWLIRNLAYVGRVSDAVDLAKNMTELPRHPKYNTFDKKNGSASYGRRRLLQVLREYHLYEQSVVLCQSKYLETEGKAEEKIKTLRLLGCSAASTDKKLLTVQVVEKFEKLLAGRKKSIAQKDKARKKLEAELEAASEQQEKTNQQKTGKQDQDKQDTDEQVAADKSEVKHRKIADIKADLKTANNDYHKARRLKGQIEKAILAIEGYRLAAEKKYAEAYKKLNEAKGEDASWLAELQYLGGEKQKGIEKAKKQVDRRKQEVIPLARYVYLLHLDKQTEKAKAALEKLRDTSCSLELSVPIFRRLTPIAKEFGYPENWLKSFEIATDTGFRPSLDSLGPFRWAPSAAPAWSLTDVNGTRHGSEQFAGRPHIVIFYLGHGCLHCAEQLQAFGPKTEVFRKAGIELVAISTDGADGLQQSLEDYEGEMPIPLLSNKKLDIFKKFRAFDDFENQPLHGTFLIDEKGKIRWQDISYEPFMDHEFLLIESQRLLEQTAKNPTDNAVSQK